MSFSKNTAFCLFLSNAEVSFINIEIKLLMHLFLDCFSFDLSSFTIVFCLSPKEGKGQWGLS